MSLGETLDKLRENHRPCMYPGSCEFCLAMQEIQTAYENLVANLFETEQIASPDPSPTRETVAGGPKAEAFPRRPLSVAEQASVYESALPRDPNYLEDVNNGGLNAEEDSEAA